MKLAKMEDGKPEIYGPVLQGEGKTQGLPVIFIRLTNCNLNCSWCDTWYTWLFDNDKRKHDYETPVKRDDYIINLSPKEVAEQIDDLKSVSKIRNVVFTGGEPTLQQDEIVEVCKLLRNDGEEWHFEVETNGTIKFKPDFVEVIDQINCSPKLESSGVEGKLRNKPDVIKQIFQIGRMKDKGLCFKFVIKKDNLMYDIKEVSDWQKLNEIESKYIYLMPEGIEREQIEETTKLLANESINGYYICTRLHVLLNGNKRAV